MIGRSDGDSGTGPSPPASASETPFTLHTHCGIKRALIDGELWLADPSLVENLGPPRGWGDPWERGTLRMLSPTEAEFEGETGEIAHFIRAKPGEADPLASGCD